MIIQVGDNSSDSADYIATINAPLVGSNGFSKTDFGTLVLNGINSGLTGTTWLNGGTLVVNGTLGTSVVASENTLLQGNGTVNELVLESGSTIAPGNSPGTFTVSGNMTMNAGSTYQFEAAAGKGHSDKIVVGGTANLGGATLKVSALDSTISYVNGQRYKVVEAGQIEGTLSSDLTIDSAFLGSTVEYSATDATLVLAVKTDPQDPTDPHPVFPKVAGTENERRTASALDQLDQTPGSASLALHNAVLMLNADQAVHAFNQLSGEGQASVRTALLEGGSQVRAQ
ncbi:autotransporter outer membrane beta-barrel domain-containing protein, partial [Aureimonas fodinaquatilis]